MVADTSRRESRLSREIRVHFGCSQSSLSQAAQVAAISAAILVVVALCRLGVTRSHQDRLISDQEAAVIRAEIASADLRGQMAALDEKLALALRALDQAKAQASASIREAVSRRSRLSPTEAKLRSLDERHSLGSQRRPGVGSLTTSQLAPAVERSQRGLHQGEANRPPLAMRLSKIGADRINPQGHRGRYKARLETAEKALQQVSADRDKGVSEKGQLVAPIAERPRGLGGGLRLAGLITMDLVQSETDLPRLDAVITDAPPEAEHTTQSVAEMGRRAVGEFRRILASTGLNIGRLFPQFDPDRAEGGPFVPPPKSAQRESFSQDKLEAMRSLIKSLPLAVPLDHFQLESRFGPRHDPFNRRRAFHTGLDLSAPYMSPVYATATGIVTYAGYRSDYGKLVEIDHGNGIATLYGHLHRYIVSAGQRIAEHTQIGFLGSTGRSSGPHVHYETRVNDEPQDPEKFIGLARVIPITAERKFER